MSEMVERVAKVMKDCQDASYQELPWETLARAAIAELRKLIIAAIEAERLSDEPQYSDDIAYNNAISHARKGVEEVLDAALKETKDDEQ